jgi:opacity protein-like surface antigen
LQHRFTAKLLQFILLSYFAAAANLALAENDSGWYASLGVGWTYADKLKVDVVDEVDGVLDYDLSIPVFSGAVGTSFLENWRVEFELSHLVTEPEVLYFPDSGIEVDPAAADRVKATNFMFNVLRDFQVGMALRPYLGFGIGPSKVQFELGEAGTALTPRREIIDDSAWALAYQAIVGITIPLTAKLELGLDYRYWRAPSVKVTDAMGRELDADQAIYSGWLQLRYRFGNTDSAWSAAQQRPGPEPRGFYLAGSLGVGRPIDAEITGSFANFDAFTPGPLVSMALGYSFNERWRIELEASHRSNGSQILDFGAAGSERRTSGEVRANSMIFNTTFRFRPGATVRPFIGAGLGVTQASYDVQFVDDDVVFVDDKANAGVFQWMLGFDIALTNKLMFTADFRMWITEKFKLEQPDGSTIKPFHVVHSTAVGLRYTF